MDHRHICLIDTISEKENNPLSSSVVEYLLTFYDVLDSTFIHVRVSYNIFFVEHKTHWMPAPFELWMSP